jgi:hypothetical protein
VEARVVAAMAAAMVEAAAAVADWAEGLAAVDSGVD